MENVTDYLTKENREYFKDRPIINAMTNTFRKRELPLYKDTLKNDYKINEQAERDLQEIYRIKGYKPKVIHIQRTEYI